MKTGRVYLHRLLVLAVMLVVTSGMPTVDSNLQEESVTLHWPSENGYVVPKTVVSDRMRLVFTVGIEGTGHHMMREVFSNFFHDSDLPFLDACPITKQLYPGLVASLSESPLEYAQAHAKLFLNMKELATQSEQDLEGYPGTIVPLQFSIFRSCPGAVMLSYPKGGGQDKELKYIDIPLMALAAEAEGLDLRLLYLSRSAADIVASTTQHRNFDTKWNENKDTEPQAKSFVRYMQILLTQATLLQAMMHEVDPAFVVCQRYDTVLSDEQVARVAEFVSPNPEVAKIFAASFEGAVHTTRPKHGGHEKQPVYEGEEVIMMRLQEKFDALDAAFCPPYQNQV